MRERERERVSNFIGIQTDGHVELKSFVCIVESGDRLFVFQSSFVELSLRETEGEGEY